MTKLSVTLACAPYDRTWPLISGRVPIEGCDVNFVVLPPSEAFVRAYRSQDFDITELSASSHILTTARGDAPYIAIPAFVSRLFRHSSFYIRTDRGIKSAKDLRGKTIGVTEYQMTAGLWARGLLSDDFGVRAQDIHWRRGGMEKPGLAERTPITLTEDIDLQPIPDGKTLSAMLAAGDLDAMIAAQAPSAFLRGAPNVARLWPDFRAAEEDYFKRTGLFPIMHLIGIRRSLVEQHPWLAPSVLKAFTRAKAIALEEIGGRWHQPRQPAVATERRGARKRSHGARHLAVWLRSQQEGNREYASMVRRTGLIASRNRPRRIVRARDASELVVLPRWTKRNGRPLESARCFTNPISVIMD